MKIENRVVNFLKEHHLHISCAESCTGGMIISTIINVPGASNVVNQSFVTYSIKAKEEILSVDGAIIDQYGVASIETAEQMVKGLRQKYSDEVLISVTGYAGGNGDSTIDGLCFYAIMYLDELSVGSVQVKGSRNIARKRQTQYILNEVYKFINKRID